MCSSSSSSTVDAERGHTKSQANHVKSRGVSWCGDGGVLVLTALIYLTLHRTSNGRCWISGSCCCGSKLSVECKVGK